MCSHFGTKAMMEDTKPIGVLTTVILGVINFHGIKLI
jgi:hypothetical protein